MIDEADDVVERVITHKSVVALMIVMLIFYSAGVNIWHSLNINHASFAQASELSQVKETLVTKDELEKKLTPINRSLNYLTCQSAIIQLDLARKDVIAYELIKEESRTSEQNRALFSAKNKVQDAQLTKQRVCKITP